MSETKREMQTGFLRRKVSRNRGGEFYSGQWCFPWLAVQLIVGKWWRKEWSQGRVQFKLAITPRITVASNDWIGFGVGIEFMEAIVNLGFPTRRYRDSFEVETNL